MSHNQVVLLLGTNLGDKNLNIKTAQGLIGKRIGEIIKNSEIIETEPVGFESNNNFLNKALFIQTEFSPISVLNLIKSIEQEMGRVYTKSKSDALYEDRIIDIDILTFNNLIFESSRLMLPHHQIRSRNFVKTLLKF